MIFQPQQRPEIEMSFVPTIGFEDIGSSDDGKDALKWYCPPESWPQTSDGSTSGWWKVVPVVEGDANKDDEAGSKSMHLLCLAPPAKRDFWRKTYCQPLLLKDDAPFLYRSVAMKDIPVMVETSFTVDAQSQFDQAGVMVRLDHEHWLKTGIEVVDGVARLSCVVTNGFSDWSTQVWPKAEIQIRVHVLPQHGGSIVVEAAPKDDSSGKNDQNDWAFIRIAHLNRNMNHDFLNEVADVKDAFQGRSPPDDSIMVGIFGACPVDQAGMVVTFDRLSITQGSTFVHDA